MLRTEVHFKVVTIALIVEKQLSCKVFSFDILADLSVNFARTTKIP